MATILRLDSFSSSNLIEQSNTIDDITAGAFMPPRMNTTQRDALTASNGMTIYNTTTNQMEAYENGSWVDL